MMAYLFFPHRIQMNGQGRTYLFDLIKKIALFCWYPSDFPINWLSD